MFESLEALTDPLIRIRVEAMYRELLDTDSNYKVLLLESDQCFQHLGTLCPRNSRKLLSCMRTLSCRFKPFLSAPSICMNYRFQHMLNSIL